MASALVVLAVASGCRETATDDYVAEIDAYRHDRIERLRSPTGWLTLVGLYWIEPGDNPLGSDETLPIVLPEDAAPPRVGTVRFDDAGVTFQPEPGVDVTVNGASPPARPLRDDTTGDMDVIELGRLRMNLIRRGERVALRIKDPESPVRHEFAGIDFYPIDPSWRVAARFERYDAPVQVEIPTVVGTPAAMWVPGRLHFELAGRSVTLDPLVEDPTDRELFLIFRDETSGGETYGAGRYLYATLGDAEKVVVDFNKAYNPPCAFTHFATCPLPPRGNRLDVAVRAGERGYDSRSHLAN